MSSHDPCLDMSFTSPVSGHVWTRWTQSHPSILWSILRGNGARSTAIGVLPYKRLLERELLLTVFLALYGRSLFHTPTSRSLPQTTGSLSFITKYTAGHTQYVCPTTARPPIECLPRPRHGPVAPWEVWCACHDVRVREGGWGCGGRHVALPGQRPLETPPGRPSSAVVATEAQDRPAALPPCRPVPPCAALCSVFRR